MSSVLWNTFSVIYKQKCIFIHKKPRDGVQLASRCRTVKPIFHQKTGLRWVPDANEMYTKNMKCTCSTRKCCVGTQRNLYSTGWRWGFASGETQILAFSDTNITQNIPTCWYILRWVTQNSGVGCTAQRQPPTPGILRSGGI